MVRAEIPREPHPLVVAHRGASVEYPENTLPSFEGALKAGADVVETDVRLTADGVPVVFHDGEVSRTTDGHGFVHELTLAEIKALDASAEGPRAEIPTLREVLELVSGRAGVNLEIKNLPGEPAFDSPREATVQAALKELDVVGFRGQVLVSSFNWLTIERSRRLAPDIPTGFLTVRAIDPRACVVYAAEAGHEFVLPEVPALLAAGAEFVREAHSSGLRVGTWTVDDPESLRTLFSWGVDAVASNDPETALAVRAEVRRSVPSP
jgi:glycerophosphoryl diester phosphodiesterase